MIKKAHRRWAIHTGCMVQRPLNFRVHRPLNTLRRQLKMVEGEPGRSRTTVLRTGASDALVSLMHHARVFPCQPTRFTCSFTLYARAQIEFVRLCESAWTKRGEAGWT